MLPATPPENVRLAERLGFPTQDETGVNLGVGLAEAPELGPVEGDPDEW